MANGDPNWGTRFKAGAEWKGNRNGRPPKDVSLTSLLKAEIDKIPPGEKQGRTWRQLLVLALLTGAMKNPMLMKELWDRLEGKAPQAVELTGRAGGPIQYQELTDEQLHIIAAQALVSQPRRGSNGAPAEENGSG